jgi:hypothetical protein
MRLPFVHIVITILLTIAHMGGEVLSCADVVCEKCADEQLCCILHYNTESRQNSHSQQEQKKDDRHSDQHSTDICSCSCHIIGIEVAAYLPVVIESAIINYHSPDYNLPSYTPSSPDHVPLV